MDYDTMSEKDKSELLEWLRERSASHSTQHSKCYKCKVRDRQLGSRFKSCEQCHLLWLDAIESGDCSSCWVAPAAPGQKGCHECSFQNKIYFELVKYFKETFDFCGECGCQERAEGSSKCASCLARRNWPIDKAKELGLCTQCGIEKAAEKRVRCAGCSEAGKKNREAKKEES